MATLLAVAGVVRKSGRSNEKTKSGLGMMTSLMATVKVVAATRVRYFMAEGGEL